MKTLFLKDGMPVATAVLAIAGAFATTSMQSSSNSFAPKTGYVLDAYGECSIAVACSDVPSQFICKLGFNGPIAFGRVELTGACTETLYRPVPAIP